MRHKVWAKAVYAGFIVVVAALASSRTLANGGDFFQELGENWNKPTPDTGPGYFGEAWDQQKRPIPKAMVTATFMSDGESVLAVTNGLGRYRIDGFSKKINPATVIIECRKQGYKLLQTERRLLRGVPNAPIEVNCIMMSVPTS